jgi:hypothetical protein
MNRTFMVRVVLVMPFIFFKKFYFFLKDLALKHVNSKDNKMLKQSKNVNSKKSKNVNSKKSKNFNFEIAKVLFPRKKEAEDEIDLFKDELITILSKHDETVWIGRKENNEKGFFPSDFVKIIRNIQTIPLENNSTLNKN